MLPLEAVGLEKAESVRRVLDGVLAAEAQA